MKIYENSRASLKEMGSEFNISYQIVGRILKKLKEKHNIAFTLELDEQALGFSEGRIIAIKFERMPDIELLKKRFKKDIYVQDAYLGSGDFDILLYVVGLTNKDFDIWQFTFRVDFSEYKPHLRIGTLNQYTLGFFPLRDELLAESVMLSSAEKKILILLNQDSRMKLSDLIAKSRSTQMRIVYTMRKLNEKGIIKKYAALTQEPQKHLFVAYTISHIPTKEHRKLLSIFFKAMLTEDFHEVVNNYTLVCNTNGFCDSLYLCAFENGAESLKKGPEILNQLWAIENPKMEKVVLTDILIGKWPFHLEKYENQARQILPTNGTEE